MYSYLLYFLDSVAHVYIVSVYIKSRFFFHYMRFVVGVLGSRDAADEKKFLNEVALYVKHNKLVDFIMAPHTSAVFKSFPDDAQFASFGSYVIDLTVSEEKLFKELHSKHRNVIRKAIKDGVVISNDPKYKDECILCVNETLKRQHVIGISPSHAIWLKANCSIDMYVAMYNGVVEGAGIFAWSDGLSSFYLYGGSKNGVHIGSLNLLQWTSILNMKKKGVKYYDFVGARINPREGSKQEGIQRFKSRFGGTLQEGYIWKMSFNNFKTSIFYFLLWLRGVISGGYSKDIIDQENEK